MTPLVSVVIPTARRPRLLRRAVASALASAPAGAAEVIVVPNGPDESWREAMRGMTAPGLRCEPLPEANGNAARNHGLALALAPYVRFLDDDDFLYPEAALRQLDLIEHAGADVCSGALDVVEDGGPVRLTLCQPATADFVAAILSPQRVTNPPAHLFRRSRLPQAPWRPDVRVRQDVVFMIDVALSGELRWVTVPEPSGAWVQHRGARTSAPYTTDADHRLMLAWLEQALALLRQRQGLTAERRQALAEALADSAHKAFPFAPAFWTGILRGARELDARARPRARLLGIDPYAFGTPAAIAWALLLPRWLGIGARRLGAAFGVGAWSRKA